MLALTYHGSHDVRVEKVPDPATGYKILDKKQEDCRKVVLIPQGGKIY